MRLLKLVPENTNIDFLKWQWPTTFLSVALMIASWVLLAVNGLNYGVDFAGGQMIRVTFTQSQQAPISALRSEIEKLGYGEPVIQNVGNAKAVSIRMRLPHGAEHDAGLSDKMAKTISADIKSHHPDARIDGVDSVSGKVSGELGWTLIDDLHRIILDQILPQFGLDGLDEAARRHLNKVWHRLDAWPDSVEGLTRLKKKYTICTLSNGNIGLLTHMAKRAGLPWDCVLSAEVFQAYKPDPRTYLGVARVFDVQPHEVMLVAAHYDDLAGARACGLRTAYVERPLEFGAKTPKDVSPRAGNDLHCRSIVEVAERLGC